MLPVQHRSSFSNNNTLILPASNSVVCFCCCQLQIPKLMMTCWSGHCAYLTSPHSLSDPHFLKVLRLLRERCWPYPWSGVDSVSFTLVNTFSSEIIQDHGHWFRHKHVTYGGHLVGILNFSRMLDRNSFSPARYGQETMPSALKLRLQKAEERPGKTWMILLSLWMPTSALSLSQSRSPSLMHWIKISVIFFHKHTNRDTPTG